MIFGLCALMACFVFASCGGNPTDTLKDLAQQIKDADEITTEEWYDIQTKAVQAQLDFYSKEDQSDEDIKAFDEALDKYREATGKVSEKLNKKLNKELDDLKEKRDDAKKKYDEKQRDKKKGGKNAD